MKQDVAVNDRDGGLRMAMQGLTGKDAAAKANDPANANDSAKASDVDILKKLENVANDAGIKAEATEVAEASQSTEKPYIPEAAKADATSGNVLDGSGSNAFKTSNFVSVAEGSPVYESNNTDAASDGTEASFKRGPSVKASKSGIKPEELQKQQAALQSTSGEAIAKAEAKLEAAKERKQGTEGSKTESQKGILSKENKLSENNNGQTDPKATGTAANAAMAPNNIDDTLSSMATERRDAAKKRLFSGRPETMPRKTLEGDDDRSVREENNALRQSCLRSLVSLFAVDGSCNIDKDVPPSDRKKAGVTSSDVMRIAAGKKIQGQEIKTHCVTISVDAGTDEKTSVAEKADEGATAPTTSSVTATSETPDWFQAMRDIADGNEQRWEEERQERWKRKDAASKIQNLWKSRKEDKHNKKTAAKTIQRAYRKYKETKSEEEKKNDGETKEKKNPVRQQNP